MTAPEGWLCPIGLCMPVCVELDTLFEILSLRINYLRTTGILSCAIITAIIIIFLRIDHYQEPGGGDLRRLNISVELDAGWGSDWLSRMVLDQ